MQTSKKWEKTGNTSFTLRDNDQVVGTMEIGVGTLRRKAIARFNDRAIKITKTGTWKNKLELKDEQGQVMARVYHEKWYANSSVLEYGNKKYKLLIRNNPLAEWVLQENQEDLLAYGLSTKDGRACVKITTQPGQANYLFDFLLWYLFVPIATEQMADDFSFLLLVSAA